MCFSCNSSRITRQIIPINNQTMAYVREQPIPIATIVERTSIEALNTTPLPSIIPNPETTRSSFLTRAFLIRFGTNAQICNYLKLDEWQTSGNKEIAITAIIQNFRNKEETLNLSNLNLSTLPENLDLPWLKRLLIENNYISDLSLLTEKLPLLFYLEASGNRLYDLISLRALPLLSNLYLKRNPIQDLRPLSFLKNLKILDLSQNEVGGATGMYFLSELEQLHLLQNLKMIEMRGNLSTIDATIFQLTFKPKLTCKWTIREGLIDSFDPATNRITTRDGILTRRTLADLNLQNGIAEIERIVRISPNLEAPHVSENIQTLIEATVIQN